MSLATSSDVKMSREVIRFLAKAACCSSPAKSRTDKSTIQWSLLLVLAPALACCAPYDASYSMATVCQHKWGSKPVVLYADPERERARARERERERVREGH